MKRNVDLTENELFSISSLEGVRVGSREMPHFRLTKYSWYHYMGKDSMEQEWIEKDKWGIYQGTKMNRLTKKVCNEQDFGIGIYCDCCGAKLYPWSKGDCLCTKCNEHLENNTENRRDVFVSG